MAPQIVLPGDQIIFDTPDSNPSLDASNFSLKFGPAILPSSSDDQSAQPRIISTKAGVVRHVASGSQHKYWVEQNQKRVSRHSIPSLSSCWPFLDIIVHSG
jgi:hypothetical protein